MENGQKQKTKEENMQDVFLFNNILPLSCSVLGRADGCLSSSKVRVAFGAFHWGLAEVGDPVSLTLGIIGVCAWVWKSHSICAVLI